jgi:hypothetical protein
MCRRVSSKQGLKLVDISIKGDSQNAKDFLSYIRGTIDEVHDRFFRGVDVERLVPCNCEICRTDAEPFMFELSRLQKHLKNNRFEISCEKGETIREVPIEGLLGAIVIERPARFELDSDRPYYGEIERTGISARDLVELIREAKSQPQPPVVQSQQVIVQPPPAETTSPAMKKGKLFWAVVIGIITLIGALLKIAIDSRTLFFTDKPKPTATTQQPDAVSASRAHPSNKSGKPERNTKQNAR